MVNLTSADDLLEKIDIDSLDGIDRKAVMQYPPEAGSPEDRVIETIDTLLSRLVDQVVLKETAKFYLHDISGTQEHLADEYAALSNDLGSSPERREAFSGFEDKTANDEVTIDQAVVDIVQEITDRVTAKVRVLQHGQGRGR